jgi:uncharacterized membrane protein
MSGFCAVGAVEWIGSHHGLLSVRSVGLIAVGLTVVTGTTIAFFIQPQFGIGGLVYAMFAMSVAYPVIIVFQFTLVYYVAWRVKLARPRLDSEAMVFSYLIGVVCGSWLGGLLALALDVRGPVSDWAGVNFTALPYLVLFASAVLPLGAAAVLYVTIPNIPLVAISGRPVTPVPELGEDDGDTEQ